MNTLKLKTLTLGILLLGTISCCKDKDEDKLPPETQEGKNTFGCLVNGKVWIPTGMVTFPSPNIHAEISKNEFSIEALKSRGQAISFNIKIPLNVGVYNLNSKNSQAFYANGITNCYYQTDTILSKGILEITKFDTLNNIVSGKFNFIAFKYKPIIIEVIGDCDSSIAITEGRFDIKYIP